MDVFEVPASTLGELVVIGENIHAIYQGGSKVAGFPADECTPIIEARRGEHLLYRRKAAFFFLQFESNNTEDN